MTNVLAIDTTTDCCSVAFATEKGRIEQTRVAPRLHNRLLLPMIDDVLCAAAVSRTSLDVVAYSAGPGSFTGVRIGAAAAQGIAFAVGAKVVAVPSSLALAETARQAAGWRGAFAVQRAARSGWRYVARFELRDDGAVCLAPDRLEAATTSNAKAIDGASFQASAGTVAVLALGRLEEAVEPALAQPLYVEGDSPWKPRAD